MDEFRITMSAVPRKLLAHLYRLSDLVESEVEKKRGLLYTKTVNALKPVAREVTMISEGRLLQAITREKVRLSSA
jgi:hypothetical protein